jgi:hypothetical protein
LKSDQPRSGLDRLLILAREREQFCRGANNLFGLGRCLGNQALIQKASIEEALGLLRQLEVLSRRLDDIEGLTFALSGQAAILTNDLDQTASALPLAEEGQRLAAANQLTDLAKYLASLVEQIRVRMHVS